MAELLAKPDRGLIEHLKEVARLGEDIARRLRIDGELFQRALLACWLHDVGKATRSFQDYMKAARTLEEAKNEGVSEEELEKLEREVKRRRRTYPHPLAGLIPSLVTEQRALSFPLIATGVILTHHSPFSERLYKGFEKPPKYDSGFSSFFQNLLQILKELGFEGIPGFSEYSGLLESPPAGVLDSPMSFGRSRKSLRGILKDAPPRDFAAVKTVLHLADWMASAQKPDTGSLFLENGKDLVNGYVDKRILKQGGSLRRFQREVQNAGERIYLQAPTGAGKTEALLLWAGDAERILYLLPTQATVNAMWKRLRRIYGEDAVGIAHGRASYILHKEYEEDPLDHRLFSSVFAKPVVVATLDQYLMGHLHGRHWEEKITLSQRSALILDEIHSYEPYTLGLLKEALAQDPPQRLALASATLPGFIMDLLGKGSLIEAEEELWKRKRHQLHLEDVSIKKALEEIIALAREGQKVLVIVNTVPKAQVFYKELTAREELAGRHPQTFLLHSRFAFLDRQEKEALIRKPEPGTILVSTQVVEVSLDISYDALFTEVAPLDALVQRMGRVNRRGENPPAPVKIFLEWDRGSELVYGRELLDLSCFLVGCLPECPSDEDLRNATNRLYSEVASNDGYRKEIDEGGNSLKYIQKVLGCYTIDMSDDEMRSRFITRRRGVLSVEVLPELYLNDAYQMVERGEKWRLVELLVPVPAYWVFGCLKEWFYPCEDLGVYVSTLPYSPDLGMECPEPETSLETYSFV